LTAQTGYDAFGNATNAAFPTRYQFTGREFDSFTGLQFSRARFYDPRLGRFISVDLLAFFFYSFLLSWFEKSHWQNATVFDGSVRFAKRDPRLSTWATLVASSSTTPAGYVGCYALADARVSDTGPLQLVTH